MKDIEEKMISDAEEGVECNHDCENCQEHCDEDSENLIVLTDDDGNDVVFEWLDVVECDGESYGVFLPLEETSEDNDDVVILHIVEGDDGNDVFECIEDDELVLKLFDMFKANNEDKFTFGD